MTLKSIQFLLILLILYELQTKDVETMTWVEVDFLKMEMVSGME
jgi:hypothetical protein